ncbi:DMT family transporter [Halomarina oriensis]|uniref:EamA family transporter n=1 Tax=Halomarina oriensis TaxID=671145 RepID=A0A6B0GPY7_9EURY|nr:DMT family transporter [Halomarina oriensis]MWG35639.1 EamA family transporter [Halomarina oriensis]
MVRDTLWKILPSTPFLFVLLATFWGTSFVAIEVGLHHVPPMLFAALRYDLAGLVVLGYAAYTTDRWRPRGRDEWAVTLVAGAFIIAGYHGLLYLGELYVSGAIAAVIVSLSPVLTVAFAALVLREGRIEGLGVLGLAFGFVGVVLVANPDPGALGSSATGIALVFFGGASFALGAVLTRPFDTDLPIATMEGWAMVLGAAMLHVAGAARGETLAQVHLTPTAVASFLYLTLVSGVVAFLLYFELLDRVGPTELNLIGYLEPVVAALMSWLVLGEFVDVATATGFAAIFLGFALLKRDTLADLTARVVGERSRSYT